MQKVILEYRIFMLKVVLDMHTHAYIYGDIYKCLSMNEFMPYVMTLRKCSGMQSALLVKDDN